jgi:SAM-dependent methyltransferase
MKLDIGCENSKKAGFIGLDKVAAAGVDVVHDLTHFPWPFESAFFDEIAMFDVLEHLPETVATLDELHRIAQPGCRVEITYPYWRSMGCYSDPTHVHFFNEHMIDYFIKPGGSKRPENKYAFYTNKYWILVSRQLIAYPCLKWMPDCALSFISRHFMDVVHGVNIVITPEK